MKYLLDTNICIYIIKRKPIEVLEHFKSLSPPDVAVSAITVAELEYGADKSQKVSKNRAALHTFLLPLEILGFKADATVTYEKLRAALFEQCCIIGSIDMLQKSLPRLPYECQRQI